MRGKEVLSFEYNQEWLKKGQPILLDPKLHFAPGPQYSQNAFGLFLDSAPDRWGRVLIQRREAQRAKIENRTPRVLFDSDYLLAVHDTCRMGALRFKTDPNGPFQNDDHQLTTPPLHALRELEQASIRLEECDPNDSEYRTWLNLLLAPGTSLGGARPKANVIDPAGNLWIAKFPSKNDEFNTGAWELVTYQLATQAGLNTVNARGETFSEAGQTFLTQRFDRKREKRIHFASAMNLLGYQDGEGAGTGASYLDLVELIGMIGENVDSDLEELWKRIVFSICVSNTDDHLRNHGFLLGERGWTLSPAYDLNPQPYGSGLALNINESSNALDLDLAMDVAEYFRLSSDQASRHLKQVRTAVKKWELLAQEHGISRSEIERMRPAFLSGEAAP
ncbi:MAG TPA: type II toxin-antitoxin system HipA family toxin [Tichowtungia sp.]|nr:type II toxin-antitoxin system HipA family toxin [Tichowtungia sp.]